MRLKTWRKPYSEYNSNPKQQIWAEAASEGLMVPLEPSMKRNLNDYDSLAQLKTQKRGSKTTEELCAENIFSINVVLLRFEWNEKQPNTGAVTYCCENTASCWQLQLYIMSYPSWIVVSLLSPSACSHLNVRFWHSSTAGHFDKTRPQIKIILIVSFLLGWV